MSAFIRSDLLALTVSVAGLAAAAAPPALAGHWSPPTTLSVGGSEADLTIDAASNLTSVWFQTGLRTAPVFQVWSSTAKFGQPWSSPQDISGSTTFSNTNVFPTVRADAKGDATAIYTNNVGVYRPAGKQWGAPATINGTGSFLTSNSNGFSAYVGAGANAHGTGTMVQATLNPVSPGGGQVTVIATGLHVTPDGAAMAPDGSLAVTWESFSQVCTDGCVTSNWVLHVSTLARGSATWVDSGPLFGPDKTSHFGVVAADGLHNVGILATSGNDLLALVRHGAGAWSTPVTVAASTTFETAFGGQTQNTHEFATDAVGHATLVAPGGGGILSVSGNLSTNAWQPVVTLTAAGEIAGSSSIFALNATGAAVVGWTDYPTGSSLAIMRAVTRAATGGTWTTPRTLAKAPQGGGLEGAAINNAGRAAVVFSAVAPDYLSFTEYTAEHQP